MKVAGVQEQSADQASAGATSCEESPTPGRAQRQVHRQRDHQLGTFSLAGLAPGAARGPRGSRVEEWPERTEGPAWRLPTRCGQPAVPGTVRVDRGSAHCCRSGYRHCGTGVGLPPHPSPGRVPPPSANAALSSPAAFADQPHTHDPSRHDPTFVGHAVHHPDAPLVRSSAR